MSSPKGPTTPPTRSSTKTPESQTEQPAGGLIEVDNDAESAYASSSQVTDTETLRSSILNYKWENGRRYHAYQDGDYWAPNDDRQQDAEDLI
ncbi:hypothetical protein QQX98_007187 [Neonectria punicea]|uniref:WW domain-containing protein n=1 Tax=Neonectria punicea TaxID=979145 RepID=A0ABR1GYM0_9HYPO